MKVINWTQKERRQSFQPYREESWKLALNLSLAKEKNNNTLSTNKMTEQRILSSPSWALGGALPFETEYVQTSLISALFLIPIMAALPPLPASFLSLLLLVTCTYSLEFMFVFSPSWLQKFHSPYPSEYVPGGKVGRSKTKLLNCVYQDKTLTRIFKDEKPSLRQQSQKSNPSLISSGFSSGHSSTFSFRLHVCARAPGFVVPQPHFEVSFASIFGSQASTLDQLIMS